MTIDHQDFERDLGAMLRQVGEGFEPDTQLLVEGGLRRGRARRSRRRAAVLTGAAAVAAVGLAVSYLPGPGGGHGKASDGTAPRTGPEMIAALSGMLPEGVEVAGVQGDGYATSDTPYVTLTLTEGADQATLSLELSRWGVEEHWTELAGCAYWEDWGATEDDCTERELSDGSLLAVYESEYSDADSTEDGSEGPGPGDGGPGQDAEEELWASHSWSVAHTSPGGDARGEPSARIVAADLTKELTGTADFTGYEPLLSVAELERIARDPVWQSVLDEVDREYGQPESYAAGEGPSGSAGPEEIERTLRSLLPPDVTLESSSDAVAGSGVFVIGNGQGLRSELSVDTWDPEWTREDFEEDIAGQSGNPQCTDEILDDGSLSIACHFLPDGTDDWELWMISLSYAEGGGLGLHQSAGSEGEPQQEAVLTAEQLAGMALDDSWRALVAGSGGG
ncbi:hypothetical protein [Streptomyces sp. YIM 98790]|uniref:hypothetical protein n=1 Tax=Streptomyces sp. YIM 98790 TaxID=2689077 RepID=UPI001408A86C|nr:hypothetical protein [Streptomyces sp. YIM 98790]